MKLNHVYTLDMTDAKLASLGMATRVSSSWAAQRR